VTTLASPCSTTDSAADAVLLPGPIYHLRKSWPAIREQVPMVERTGWMPPLFPGSFSAYCHRPQQLLAELGTPRLVVGVRQAGHQPRLDPPAVGDDQGGGAIRHGLHDPCPDAQMRLGDRGQAAATAEQLGTGAVRVRPAP
jgi:hypothetical protein